MDRYGKVELKMKKDTGIDEKMLTHIGNVSVKTYFASRILLMASLSLKQHWISRMRPKVSEKQCSLLK